MRPFQDDGSRYSVNRGRAEFGQLRPRSREGGSKTVSRQVSTGGSSSRDYSGERQAQQQQQQRQTQQQQQQQVPSTTASAGFRQFQGGGGVSGGGGAGGHQVAVVVGVQQQQVTTFEPSVEVLEKKKEILQLVAGDKKKVKDATGEKDT